MDDARRFRVYAAECLLAAKDCDPHYRNLTTAIAASWHALARQAEATDALIESWNKEDSAAFADELLVAANDGISVDPRKNNHDVRTSCVQLGRG